MVWYFFGEYIINRTLHGRLETRNFSSRVVVSCLFSSYISVRRQYPTELIGSKTLPRIQNTSQNPKHVPEPKKLPRIQKHIPESKYTSQNSKHIPKSRTLPRGRASVPRVTTSYCRDCDMQISHSLTRSRRTSGRG